MTPRLHLVPGDIPAVVPPERQAYLVRDANRIRRAAKARAVALCRSGHDTHPLVQSYLALAHAERLLALTVPDDRPPSPIPGADLLASTIDLCHAHAAELWHAAMNILDLNLATPPSVSASN
jgi:hypothetical protein